MKKIILGFTCILCICLVFLTHNMITSQTVRSSELKATLSSTMDKTVKEVMNDNSYAIHDVNEFMKTFIMAFMCNIQSDLDVSFNVLDIDLDKGILSIEAKGKYFKSDVNHTEKEIIVQRNILLNKETTK